MDEKIKAAIERGNQKYAQEQEELRLKAQEKRRKEEEEAAKWKAGTIAHCKSWIEDVLPRMIERVTGEGLTSVRFSVYRPPSELAYWSDEQLAILMPMIAETGLKTEINREYCDAVNDDGMQWDAHWSYDYLIAW